jgi:predicted nucleic acid-binding protein
MDSNTVIYDACVLYPAPLRDFLMHLAMTDVFQAKWSNLIHDEWIRNVLLNRTDLKPEILERTRQLMNRHVRDCLVENFEHLIPSIHLPDKDDRHVVAAAIHSNSNIIITFNLRDFPKNILGKLRLQAQHPDDFIFNLLNSHPAPILNAAMNHRKSLKNPPKTVDEYIDTLLKQGLPKTVKALRDWQAII